MKQYISILQKSELFAGATEAELSSMLTCLHAKVSHFSKNEIILKGDTPTHYACLMLSGLALLEQLDITGTRTIISEFLPGMSFGESDVLFSKQSPTTTIIASKDSEVLFLDMKRLLHLSDKDCIYHSPLMKKLLLSISAKNLALTQKLELLSKKTIREKLLSYLSIESEKAGKAAFEIPFDRQQLADYLNVDRSALSAEISKLQKEGVLLCKKNYFQLTGFIN